MIHKTRRTFIAAIGAAILFFLPHGWPPKPPPKPTPGKPAPAPRPAPTPGPML